MSSKVVSYLFWRAAERARVRVLRPECRRPSLEAYGPAFIHWTVKLVPSVEIAEGSDLTTPELDWLTIVISWIAEPYVPMSARTPLTATAQSNPAIPVLSAPKPAVPKLERLANLQ